MSQGRRTQRDGTPTGRRWDDLSIKNNHKSEIKDLQNHNDSKKEKGKGLGAGEQERERRGRNGTWDVAWGGASVRGLGGEDISGGHVQGTSLEGCLRWAAGDGVGEVGEELSGGRGTK